MAMGQLFKMCGLDFEVAHVNFGLRGEESDGDEQFVRNLAESWQVPCHVMQADTKKTAAELGLSVQMAAREIRYGFFNDLLTGRGLQCICTAHQLNDNLEHLFIYLHRNSKAAWKGIPLSEGNVVRPMLFATADEIRTWLRESGYSWREDSSNQSIHYLRNQIRHWLMPGIEESASELLLEFYELSREFSAAESRREEKINRWAGRFHQGGQAWYFREADPQKLRQFLEMKGMSSTEAAKCVRGTNIGSIHYFGGLQAERRSDGLFVLRQTEPPEPLKIERSDLPCSIRWGLLELNLEEMEPGEVELHKTFDWHADADAAFPLRLRSFLPGERMKPLGMEGSKKISDVFSEDSIPNLLKPRMPVIESEQGVIGVLPVRRSRLVLVNENTKKVLRIQWRFLPEEETQ